MSPQVIVYQPISLIFSNNFWDQTPINGLDWKPFIPNAEIISIPVTLLILLVCIFIYYFKVKKSTPDKAPTGYVLMVEILVTSFENMTIELLGERYKKITPYFLVLFVYISISNLLGIVGLMPPTSSLTVTFSMGIITFFGTIYMGLKHQRLSYLKNFMLKIKVKNKEIPIMINPLSLISEIAPLLSISMRLWGNIFAGSLIMGLFYAFIQYIFSSINPVVLALSLGTIFGGLLAPIFHAYFDLMIGLIQAYVFVMLTYTYWGNQITNEKSKNVNKSKNINLNKNVDNVYAKNLNVHDQI